MTPRTRALLDYIHAPNQRAATDVIIDAAKAGTFNDDQPRLDGPSDAAVFAAAPVPEPTP